MISKSRVSLMPLRILQFWAWLAWVHDDDDDKMCTTCPYACVLSHFSRVQLFAILWTVACQAPLSMEFFWQEYWSGLPFASQGACPNPGIEPTSLMSPALAGGFFTTSVTWEAHHTTEQIVSSDLLGPRRWAGQRDP